MEIKTKHSCCLVHGPARRRQQTQAGSGPDLRPLLRPDVVWIAHHPAPSLARRHLDKPIVDGVLESSRSFRLARARGRDFHGKGGGGGRAAVRACTKSLELAAQHWPC